MHILFLTDNFPPEVNAPATRTYEHAIEWIKLGAKVTVITSNPNFPKGELYSGYKNRLYSRKEIDGITVIRVWTFIAKNEGFLLRILDYLSFALMSLLAGFFQKGDIIVATSPQFFTAVSGFLLSALKRKPWVFEVRDLWPESIRAVGAMRDSFLLRALTHLELFLYKQAHHIVVVTEAFKARIASRGIREDKISVIKNGAALDRLKKHPKDLELLRQLGVEGKFIVGYLGTHGMAHGLDFILQQAKLMESIKELAHVHFLFMGDGAEKSRLLSLHERLALQNVTLLPPVTKEQAVQYLNLFDVALVNLRRSETFTTVIPSKIFEAAALEKPILLGVDGEARQLMEGFHAGVYFEPENGLEFERVLRSLVLQQEFYERCQQGCQSLAAEYSRSQLAKDMHRVLLSTMKVQK